MVWDLYPPSHHRQNFLPYCERKVAGLFRPRSTSSIINSYITPRFAIITTSIYHPINIIDTDTTLLFYMKILIYTTIRNWWSQQSTTVTWDYGSNIGCSETYIHLSLQHKLLFHNRKRKSGWYLLTYIHLYQHHYHDNLRDYEMKSGWYQETYVHIFHHLKTIQEFCHQKFNHHYEGGRKSGWSHETSILDFHHHSQWKHLLRWLGWYCSLGVMNGLGKWIASGHKSKLCQV